MSNKTEVRTLAMSLRAVKNGAFEISGVAASYGVLSQDLGGFREQLAPGCFARSLRSGDDVKCLFNHDPNQILGRTANKTLTLWDGSDSLNFLCKLNPDSQAHRDLHASIKRGDISECSFAFAVEDGGDEFDEAKDENGQRFKRRTLKRAKLLDVSCVTSPAYTGDATSVSARSRVADYNTHRPPQRTVSARPPVVVKASTLSFREASRLSKQYGVCVEEVNIARSIEQTSGVPMADTLNRIHLRAVTARVERAAQLRKLDDEPDDDDPDSDWNEKAHARAATKHRFVAQHSSLDDAVKHYSCADAHQQAADNFNRTNSRKARKTSRLAFPLEMVS
ncbi:MAG TPA: HK97 family phage prohead protease [Candidatus Acidoferrum sp.]|jgi:HK97 family phage prohead protease|nr:HK97 family phage prohead protease [Candidatus Acidoferrum sp.]